MRPIKPINQEPTNWRDVLEQIYKILRQNISFGDGVNSDNIDGVFVNTVSVGVNQDYTVNHTLGRVPVRFIVMGGNDDSITYAGTIPATDTQITLKSTRNGANVSVF